MSFRVGRTSVAVSPLFFWMLCFLLLIDQTGLMPITILCSLMHEAGHLIAMRITRCQPLAIRVTPCGMEIDRAPETAEKETVMIALAGPLVNLIFSFVGLLILRFFPDAPMIGFIAVNALIFLLNLLPVRGLDGGEIASCILIKRKGREKGERLFSRLSYFVSLLILFFGIVAVIGTANLSLSLVGLYLLMLNLFKI